MYILKNILGQHSFACIVVQYSDDIRWQYIGTIIYIYISSSSSSSTAVIQYVPYRLLTDSKNRLKRVTYVIHFTEQLCSVKHKKTASLHKKCKHNLCFQLQLLYMRMHTHINVFISNYSSWKGLQMSWLSSELHQSKLFCSVTFLRH